jgi:2-amino-4-hydroxy-6-hydroxymethyldihydropteridine diphosphokinase
MPCYHAFMTEVYIGLGGNIGNAFLTLHQALSLIGALENVQITGISRFYDTSPVSDIPQNNFVNAVCRCETTLSAFQLLKKLQEIETSLGKKTKAKNAPRLIDLDILFFGQEKHSTEFLEIPHPRWKERLFVLYPLSDLTSEITVPESEGTGLQRVNLLEYLKTFPNPHHETVRILNYG